MPLLPACSQLHQIGHPRLPGFPFFPQAHMKSWSDHRIKVLHSWLGLSYRKVIDPPLYQGLHLQYLLPCITSVVTFIDCLPFIADTLDGFLCDAYFLFPLFFKEGESQQGSLCQMAYLALLSVSFSLRSLSVRPYAFYPCSLSISIYVFCSISGFCFFCNITHTYPFYMEFLYVISDIYRQLLSDSQSPTTPLLLANDKYCNSRSGFPPCSIMIMPDTKKNRQVRTRRFIDSFYN